MSIGSFLTRIRKQTAIYWALPTPDGYGGYTYAEPVEVPCRWSDVVTILADISGEQYISGTSVIVDRKLDIGGYLMLGEIDSSTPDTPESVESACKITKFMEIPDIKNQAVLYKALL